MSTSENIKRVYPRSVRQFGMDFKRERIISKKNNLYPGYYQGNGLIVQKIELTEQAIELFSSFNLDAVRFFIGVLKKYSRNDLHIIRASKLQDIYYKYNVGFTSKEFQEVLEFFKINELIKIFVNEEYPYGLIIPNTKILNLISDREKEC